MKTKIVQILIGIFFCCNAPIFAQNLKTFVDQKNGFAISYPKSWITVSQGKKSPVRFLATTNNDQNYPNASAYLTISKYSGSSPLDSIADRYTKQLRTRGDIVSEIGESTINGQNYYYLTSLEESPTEKIKSKYYLTVYDHNFIVVRLFTRKVEDFPIFYEALQQIINSLKLF